MKRLIPLILALLTATVAVGAPGKAKAAKPQRARGAVA